MRGRLDDDLALVLAQPRWLLRRTTTPSAEPERGLVALRGVDCFQAAWSIPGR